MSPWLHGTRPLSGHARPQWRRKAWLSLDTRPTERWLGPGHGGVPPFLHSPAARRSSMSEPTHVDVDVVVIGAGIIGASCAYHLSSAGQDVAVLEARGGYAEGSSGRSFASVRSQWADDLSIDLSWNSIRTYQRFEAEHGIDVGYRPTGYLLLWGEEVWTRQLEAVKLQRQHGVPVEVLDPVEAQRFIPFAPDGIAGATYGPEDGRIDPHIATGAFLDLARARGATVHLRSPVTAIERHPDGTWVVRSA